MSATLNVGQWNGPIHTSMKSTTPRALLIRSIRLPTAPPHTSARASSRTGCDGSVCRTMDQSTTSATTARAMKIQRE